MKPSYVAGHLRRIAGLIKGVPALRTEFIRLNRIADEIHPPISPEEAEGMKDWMHRDFPKGTRDNAVIQSHYQIEDADIYYTYMLSQEDLGEMSRAYEYDKKYGRPSFITFDPKTIDPDTMEGQKLMESIKAPVKALIIFPDLDFTVDYDGAGSEMSSDPGHKYDENGKLIGKTGHWDFFNNKFSDIKEHGALVPNDVMKEKMAEHKYKNMWSW